MTNDSNSPPPSTGADTNTTGTSDALPRRDFLKVAGAGAGMALLGGASTVAAAGVTDARRVAAIRTTAASPDIVVIGAGAWGSWTALQSAQDGREGDGRRFVRRGQLALDVRRRDARRAVVVR